MNRYRLAYCKCMEFLFKKCHAHDVKQQMFLISAQLNTLLGGLCTFASDAQQKK